MSTMQKHIIGITITIGEVTFRLGDRLLTRFGYIVDNLRPPVPAAMFVGTIILAALEHAKMTVDNIHRQADEQICRCYLPTEPEESVHISVTTGNGEIEDVSPERIRNLRLLMQISRAHPGELPTDWYIHQEIPFCFEWAIDFYLAHQSPAGR